MFESSSESGSESDTAAPNSDIPSFVEVELTVEERYADTALRIFLAQKVDSSRESGSSYFHVGEFRRRRLYAVYGNEGVTVRLPSELAMIEAASSSSAERLPSRVCVVQ